MQNYIFDTEQEAIDAEQWICDKATELGMGFKQQPEDVTECYAIPTLREIDSKWIFPRIPDGVRDGLSQNDIVEFMTLFNPVIEEST